MGADRNAPNDASVKGKVDCTEFCKCKGFCEIWKGFLKNNFWGKRATTIKNKFVATMVLYLNKLGPAEMA